MRVLDQTGKAVGNMTVGLEEKSEILKDIILSEKPLVRKPGETLHGRVVSASGARGGDILVRIEHGTTSAEGWTDGEGKFCVALPAPMEKGKRVKPLVKEDHMTLEIYRVKNRKKTFLGQSSVTPGTLSR